MLGESRCSAKAAPILLIGLISVFFAEGLSGSMPLWFLDPWGLLVTFPLYWTHTLLFLNLALRYRRTSLPQLYLWGVLYGFYESWITKVIWAGYMEEAGPQFGSFLGFATGEFLIIGLFWHAIYSFILPILFYEMIAGGLDRPGFRSLGAPVLSSHLSFLKNNIQNRVLFFFLFLTGMLFLYNGLAMDPISALIAVAGNVGLIGGVLLLSNDGEIHRINSLRLGNRGLAVVFTYLIALYTITFFLLLPERIAAPETILITIGFYAFILGLLYLSPPRIEESQLYMEEKEYLDGKSDLVVFIALALLLASLVSTPDAIQIPATLLYLGMMITGPILLILSIIWVLFKRIRMKTEDEIAFE